MFSINKDDNTIEKIQPTKFSDLGFSERNHLQEWIAKNPAALGEELLIIQKEFDGFDDTRERLDLLALDKDGNLVIIENKLDDSGRNVTWQALKYASYCSTLTKDQIVEIYQAYLDTQDGQENQEQDDKKSAKHRICTFLGHQDADDATFKDLQLNQEQRIIFIAKEYRKEVTSTVLWLMLKHKMKIQCFKVTPYDFNEQYFLDIEQIIPVKETEEFMIKMAEKDRDDQKGSSLRASLLQDFWGQVIARCKTQNITLFNNITPPKHNWIGTSTGISGLGVNLVMTNGTGRIELYISKSNPEENTRIFNELLKSQDMIQQELGYELTWESLDDKKACRIKAELSDVGTFDQQTWDTAINFFVGNVQKFYDVFKKHLANIN